MEYLTQINDMLTQHLGEFGPLIVVGVLGMFMILVTMPILLRSESWVTLSMGCPSIRILPPSTS